MLSFRVSYSIQILSLLQSNEKGMTTGELRNHFYLLPQSTLISGLLRRLHTAGIIGKVNPSSSRYELQTDLTSLTLDTLITALEEKLVFGQPVCYPYWHPGYLDTHPQITELEEEMHSCITELTETATIGELLDKHNPQVNKHNFF